jgi:hypothetical protein
VGDPPRLPRDTPLDTKFGTKFRQQVAVAQSVYFACGLKATEANYLAKFRKMFVRFEGCPAVTMENSVFWDVTPCGFCKNRRFGRT